MLNSDAAQFLRTIRLNPAHQRRRGGFGLLVSAVLFAGLLFTASLCHAAELSDAIKLYNGGKYTEAIDTAAREIKANPFETAWYPIKIRAELATGQYPQAMQDYQLAVMRDDANIPLRMLGFEVLRLNNRPQDATNLLVTIRAMVVREPYRYSDPVNRVALGRSLLKAGADARQVLELFFDSAKKDDPSLVDAYLASGELALDKQDYPVAAESYNAAAKLSPENPDIYYGLARSYESDPAQATAALAKALELNPRHIDSLLLEVDGLIDQEAYDRAATLLDQVLQINPHHSRAWAYRAVLAHLSGDRAKEQDARTQALQSWATNPEVDWLIGQKVAQKYRFAEGAAYQRAALRFDPTYRPAKLELCEDLLRLGQEDEGWRLADEVFKEDQYNVLAYNLVTLHDAMKKFVEIRSPHFILRMDPLESQIYGQRTLDLLERARQTLCTKYGLDLSEPTTVEMFPQQKDFAIRTFGLPGGVGYLGVCFGSVITANSPASRGGNPSNWQAMLWHEFCHVVTLHLTQNKMPRWLSEGISVYEEKQQNPAWGQTMNPQYREFIQQEPFTPVSKLSSAFMAPPSGMHLQFAYYESSMVVQYIVERWGSKALAQILKELAGDVPINTALAKYTEPIDKLDADFEQWLKLRAASLAPKADLARPDLPLDADSAEVIAWNKDHPNNFWGLLSAGRALLAEHKLDEAKATLEAAVALYPDYGAPGGPYLLLAAVAREQGDVQQERRMLENHVALSADAVEPRLRLLELDAQQKDWPAVRDITEQVLAINPLIPAPYRYLIQAAEALNDHKLAIEGHRTILLMNPLDPADHHFRLAKLLVDEKQLPEARRQTLLALEQAPRFLAAHQLLLDIVAQAGPTSLPGIPATRPAASTQPAPMIRAGGETP